MAAENLLAQVIVTEGKGYSWPLFFKEYCLFLGNIFKEENRHTQNK